ncbi:MAG: hypothetical protein EXS15_03695 [Phycisphaerales bacterium]|nr:hypothetical protein [Phycisphaerales bacterium]
MMSQRLSAREIRTNVHASVAIALAAVVVWGSDARGAPIQSGPLAAWGDNQYGQTTIPTDLGRCTQIAAGYGHTVAIRRIDRNGNGIPDANELSGILRSLSFKPNGKHSD